MQLFHTFGEAATTALGFFWKSGWAFVLGYFISAMIQTFVPKGRLGRFMGSPDLRSVSFATAVGALSSSCSFAALAAARALVAKGAHFVAAVAFMFASTNLVIELGILILVFLGWQFLAAELVGGLVLITLSSLLIRLTYPRRWLREGREQAEATSPEEEDFDWRRRIRSRRGWRSNTGEAGRARSGSSPSCSSRSWRVAGSRHSCRARTPGIHRRTFAFPDPRSRAPAWAGALRARGAVPRPLRSAPSASPRRHRKGAGPPSDRVRENP